MQNKRQRSRKVDALKEDKIALAPTSITVRYFEKQRKQTDKQTNEQTKTERALVLTRN